MHIEADHTLCGGIGMCESMAPEYFQVGDDGFVEILQAEVDPAERKYVAAAVDACPMQALLADT